MCAGIYRFFYNAPRLMQLDKALRAHEATSNRVAGTEFVPTQEGAEPLKKHPICFQSPLQYTKTGEVKCEEMYWMIYVSDP